MNKYRVSFSNKANQDLIDIYDYIYITLSNPLSANRIVKGILKQCESLGTFPAGSLIRVRRQNLEFRFAHYKNYTIVYYIEGDAVVIHRVLYSFRDISNII